MYIQYRMYKTMHGTYLVVIPMLSINCPCSASPCTTCQGSRLAFYTTRYMHMRNGDRTSQSLEAHLQGLLRRACRTIVSEPRVHGSVVSLWDPPHHHVYPSLLTGHHVWSLAMMHLHSLGFSLEHPHAHRWMHDYSTS